MEKKSAESLIKDTFNAKFNLEQYTLFMRNLLNDYDEDKERDWAQGNYIYESFREHINRFKRLGIYTDPEGNEVELLVIETKATSKLERARTSLRNFVIKRLNDKNRDYALAAFYSKEDNGEDWRFSYIKIEHESYKDQKGKVKTKKELTPAKRFSFLVGEHEHAYTAQKQLLPVLQNDYSNPNIEDLESCFSIEKVTDEFFEQYKELYLKLSEHFSNDKSVQKILSSAGINSNRFTKKLLGQIVFLYFLQKKGWLGVPKNEPWGKGEKKFMQALYNEAIAEKQNFFKDYLQYLFYEALAKARTNSPDPSYYKRFDCKIPFLNGGLFEADYDWQNANLSIPNNLFRNEEKNKAGDKGTGILDVFDRYNFTIKEDEPLEKEVAVDPEMLGKVFENMLEITERKSKGAFYTPREIVHYMCQESLINYLDNAVNDATESYQAIDSDQLGMFEGAATKKGQAKIEIQHKGKILVPKEDIEVFVRKGFLATENDQLIVEKGKETSSYRFQLPETVRTNADELDRHLTSIKICDPAIGSGAFPVGLLHELVTAQKVLLPYLSGAYFNKKLAEIDLDKADFKKEPAKYIYRVKRHAIQESIYGVDIDASAIDIARLRLWLSLIVDEEDFYSIEALPNLDYKIVHGSSIVGFPKDVLIDHEASKSLEVNKESFFKTTEEEKKKALRKLIDADIQKLLETAEQLTGFNAKFDFKLFFSEVWHYKNGFDIIIGNPPYGAKFSEDEKKVLQRAFPKIKGQPESYEYFLFKAIDALGNKKAVISLIIPTNFIESKRAQDLRKYILDSGLINTISNFRYNVWKNNASETLIFIYERNEVGKTKVIHPENEYEFEQHENYAFFNQKEWYKTPGNRFIVRSDSKMLTKIELSSEKFGNVIEVSQGIIVYKTREESALNKYISDTPQKGWVKLLDSKSRITKWKIDWGGRYLNYGNWLWSPRDEKYFNQEKILFIRLRNKSLKRKLIGALDKNFYYNRDNFNNIIPKDKTVNIKYTLAIFNSDVINYWYKSMFDNVNINPEQVRLIPFRKCNDQKAVAILVDYCTYLAEVENDAIVFNYFNQIVEACIYEIYFKDEVKSANKGILHYLNELKLIDDDLSDENKLSIIQSEFNRLYDPNHPVRNNIETLDSVEEVRIIKEALK